MPPIRRGVMLCPLPAHGDTNPSASVKRLSDGIERWYCHRCNEWGSSVDLAAAILGVDEITATRWLANRYGIIEEPHLRLLKPVERPVVVKERRDTASPADGTLREVVAYPYHDAQGTLLYEVVRFEPKTFRFRRPDGSWGLGGVQRVLFRLPAILAALESRERVYLAEGEKDALALADRGYCGTTAPMGAGKWLATYTQTLANGRVAIIADRDTAGRQHARAVYRELRAANCQVAVYESVRGKDVSDHFAAGFDVTGLRKRFGTSAESL